MSSSSSLQELPDVWVIPRGFSYGDFSLGSRKDVFRGRENGAPASPARWRKQIFQIRRFGASFPPFPRPPCQRENCKNFRSTPTSSRATDEFRELNFLMLTVGHAKSAWGALTRCLHRFSRHFHDASRILTPTLPWNIGNERRGGCRTLCAYISRILITSKISLLYL